MFKSHEISIPAPEIISLCWHDDTLIDWAAGGERFYLDGKVEPSRVRYSFEFDSAIMSPSGEYAAIFVQGGTKGVILHHGKIIREIDRSFYHANAYMYPITMFRLKNGQEILAHCPKHYNRLELDDLKTGKRLTNIKLEVRKPSDFFFSRLAANSSGSFLFSAGWHWHPMDHVKVFDLEEALKDPNHLDGPGLNVDTWAEYSSACFLDDNQLVVSLSSELPDDEEIDYDPMSAGDLHIFDLSGVRLISKVPSSAMVGTLMPLGPNHVIGFYEYPKLFDLKTGEVVQSWPHIQSGKRRSGIGISTQPVIALDPKNWRFAVADQSAITVVEIEKPSFPA